MYPHAAEQFKKIVVQISIQRKKKRVQVRERGTQPSWSFQSL
jgi:hypothetical protein